MAPNKKKKSSRSSLQDTASQQEQELERSILADLDSPEMYAVFGDFLQSQGDPLGEYVAAQIARDSKPKQKKLRDEEEALLAAHRDDWLGVTLAAFEEDAEVIFTWRWGFLYSANIGQGNLEHDGTEAFVALRKCPAARFLRELHFGALIETTNYQPIIDLMAEHGIPKSVHTLVFDTRDMQDGNLGLFTTLYPKLEHLKTLKINTDRLDLGVMKLPNLVHLEVAAKPITFENIASIAMAPSKWPKLETLTLTFHETRAGRYVDSGDDEYPPTEAIVKLCERIAIACPALKSLTLEGLYEEGRGHELVTAFIDGKKNVLKQLEHLSLARDHIRDDTAKLIAKNPNVFSHLKTLNLSRNLISAATCAEIAKVLPKIADTRWNG